RQLARMQQLQAHRMDGAFREAAGAIGAEAALTEMIEQRLGQDAPGRVAGAEKEDVVDLLHGRAHPPQQADLAGVASAAGAGPQQGASAAAGEASAAIGALVP